MMYHFFYQCIKLAYPRSTGVHGKHYKHPKHMEDMGNPAGNSRLPDVLCVFAPHDNPLFDICLLHQIGHINPPGSTLVIFAKYFNTIALDINNRIALILLYFGPTALIDGPIMHPVTMEDICNLALLGSQRPDAIFIWICHHVDPRNNTTPSMQMEDIACSYGIYPLKVFPSYLTQTYC